MLLTLKEFTRVVIDGITNKAQKEKNYQ